VHTASWRHLQPLAAAHSALLGSREEEVQAWRDELEALEEGACGADKEVQAYLGAAGRAKEDKRARAERGREQGTGRGHWEEEETKQRQKEEEKKLKDSGGRR